MPTPENMPRIPEKENIPEEVGGNRETPQNLPEFTNQLTMNLANNVNNKFRELKKIDSTENNDAKKEIIGYQLKAAEGAAILGREYGNLSQENFQNEQKFRKEVGNIFEIELSRENEGTSEEENTVTLTAGQKSNFFLEGEFGSKLNKPDTVTFGYTYTGDSLEISVGGSKDPEKLVPGLEVNIGNFSGSVNIPLENGALSVKDYETSVEYELLIPICNQNASVI